MDIEELEFLRCFADGLHNLSEGISKLSLCIEEKEYGDEIENAFLWSLYNQSELLDKLLDGFRERTNKKYHSVWKEKYPYMKD